MSPFKEWQRQPLHSLYSFLFGVSMFIIFVQLLGSIIKIFQSPIDFGALGRQFMAVTLFGAIAGFFHHWYAYRDLGHIGLPADNLGDALPHWINTRAEVYVRIAAISLMLIAFSKGYVIVELGQILMENIGMREARVVHCHLINGVCAPAESVSREGEQALFLISGTLLSLALLIWSAGAYRTRNRNATRQSKITDKELVWWLVTDLFAVMFWSLCVLLLLLEMKVVALALAFIALLYCGIMVWRYIVSPRLKGQS